jgi:fatty acid desaturase
MAASNADPIKWYRVPIARDELRQLTARSDFRALLQTLGHLLLLAASGAAAWIAWDAAEQGHAPVWAVVALVYLHGTFWAFLLNGFHELVHYTVFKTRALGTLFVYLFSFLGWEDPVEFKASHIRHHLYTLHPPRDREVQLPIRMRLRHFLRVAFVDPLLLYHRVRDLIVKATGRFTSDWQREIITEEGEKTHRALIRFARAHLLVHLGIIIISAVTGTWQLAVLITFAKFYGRGLEFLCNETQHIGLADSVPDFRLCCRTFTASPFVRFLYWNMNYHTEHTCTPRFPATTSTGSTRRFATRCQLQPAALSQHGVRLLRYSRSKTKIRGTSTLRRFPRGNRT